MYRKSAAINELFLPNESEINPLGISRRFVVISFDAYRTPICVKLKLFSRKYNNKNAS